MTRVTPEQIDRASFNERMMDKIGETMYFTSDAITFEEKVAMTLDALEQIKEEVAQEDGDLYEWYAERDFN